MPRSGSGSASAVELGVGDRLGLAQLVAARVADGLLALGIGPPSAVGDQLAMLAYEQVANDLPKGAELAGLHQPSGQLS